MSSTKALRNVAAMLLAVSTSAAGIDEPQVPAELLLRNFSPRPLHGLVLQDDATRVVFVPLGGSQTIWLRSRTATLEIDGPPRLVRTLELAPRSRVIVDVPGTR